MTLYAVYTLHTAYIYYYLRTSILCGDSAQTTVTVTASKGDGHAHQQRAACLWWLGTYNARTYAKRQCRGL